MTQHPLIEKLTGTVECDETYVGGKVRVLPYKQKDDRQRRRFSGTSNKAAVFSVLQRDGSVRSRHVERVTAENLKPVIDQMIAEDAEVMTDSSTVLHNALAGRLHYQVNHADKEYVRYENGKCITTNGIEGFFSLLKRGIYGTYHQVGKPYLQQYLNEFDFRYNNRKITDLERTEVALKATEGKRLTLRRPIGVQ